MDVCLSACLSLKHTHTHTHTHTRGMLIPLLMLLLMRTPPASSLFPVSSLPLSFIPSFLLSFPPSLLLSSPPSLSPSLRFPYTLPANHTSLPFSFSSSCSYPPLLRPYLPSSLLSFPPLPSFVVQEGKRGEGEVRSLYHLQAEEEKEEDDDKVRERKEGRR